MLLIKCRLLTIPNISSAKDFIEKVATLLLQVGSSHAGEQNSTGQEQEVTDSSVAEGCPQSSSHGASPGTFPI